ncbi:MAG TPA: neutral zinc metallopeptidase [Synechococcales cyanobacterium M55_K2018_004]|nr:neutral zinc metallopeptidase [Synechococcales cyanobacterium M55_K2018_004]
MRWEYGRRSDNVEDRRSRGMGAAPVVGGGIGTILIALLVAFLGGDPSAVLNQGAPYSQPYPTQIEQRSPQQDQLADFTSVVLADTEDVWNQQFRQLGGTYVEPKLVLFTGAVESACGYAEAAVGPFYCPRDQKVYIDLSFYNDMKTKLNAPGDFAQAYVVAHEVGHHVQNLLGISSQVQSLQRRVSKTQANQLSVRLELQADCLAGVWANNAQSQRQILEPGDIEEALNAASAIGDDRLQREARGYVVPDSFTHGTSAQRVRWFRKGFEAGTPEVCNTFETNNL